MPSQQSTKAALTLFRAAHGQVSSYLSSASEIFRADRATIRLCSRSRVVLSCRSFPSGSAFATSRA
jgi:hypothetical protein